MKIRPNGVQVYSDVEGAGLRANGSAMQEMPTLNLLHRGTGADHSNFYSASPFSQVA